MPQEIKNHLKPLGWTPEVRVPPFHVRYDDLRINDRYDLWKSFELDGARIGVAIEIERWEVWNDLLKFRRGIQRGQIAAGVILHDSLESLTYVFEHLRLVSEPLFSELPILFVAPAGEGLKNAANPRALHFGPLPNARRSIVNGRDAARPSPSVQPSGRSPAIACAWADRRAAVGPPILPATFHETSRMTLHRQLLEPLSRIGL